MDDSVSPEVTAPVSPERQAAEERMNKWQAMPLAHLEHAADEEKQAGRWNPQTSALFSELAQNKVSDWQDQVKDAPADQVRGQAQIDLDAGNISRKFFDTVVKDAVLGKVKEDENKSLWQHTKDIISGVAEHPLEVIGAPIKSVMEAGRLMGASAAGDQAAGSQIGAALESNALRGANMLQGLASYVLPDKAQAALSEATGGFTPQKSLERQQLKAGDVDAWWNTYNQNRLPEHRAMYGEGLLNKAVGLNASELDKDGIHVSPTEYAESNIAGMGADPTNFIPVHLGASVAANGAKMVLNSTEAGSKVLGVLEKFAGPVKSGTIAPTLETKADAVTRLAADAEKYNTSLKRARVAAGNLAVSAGQALKTAGTKTASGGLTSAGLAYLAGADPKEAVMAGLAGAILGSRVSRAVAGTALEIGGKVLRSDLPLPLENFRRGYIDFTKDYNVVRAATAGAASGLASSAVFALGADDDQARSDLLLGGAALGAGAAFAQRAEMAISDRLVKSRFGGKASGDVGPVAPSAPLGTNTTADAVHAAAEDRLSQDGLRISKQARAVASSFGGEFYAASDGQGLQALHDSLSKTPRDVSGNQGFSISAEDSVTGKPVAASQIGSVNGQSSGHEVGHLIMNTLGAYPEGKVVADNILIKAANALGATWDSKSESLQHSSPMLDAIRDHYQQASSSTSPISHEYALHEFIAEHFSAMSAGLPAGKLGGSSSVANAVSKAFFKIGDLLTNRKAGLAASGVTTSSVLPYSPDFDLFKATQNTVDAFMYEHSKDVPSASMEDTQPIPKKNPLEPSGPVAKGTTVPVRPEGTPTFSGGEGILNPIPTELATDQSLKTSTPPQQARPEAAAPAEAPTSEVTPQGAIRSQEVQAARTNTESALSPEDKALVQKVQADPAKQPVLERVVSFVKSLGGQRVGLPIVEASINQDGVVRSKRLAPYDIDRSSPDKPVVISVDLDRANYNAKLLFDWAARKGTPERFGYTGVNDPKFTQDLQTYLRNQAEGRRGSGEPLKAEGIPPATGEAFGKLTRDQELFFNTIMGQTPPKELTARSLGAIARINATARASGIEPRTTETGSVEPNSLRDQLRSEGAPIDRIGEDPDPTRRQTNPKDRNSVITRTRLQDFVDFKPTDQSVSQPNTRAIEASFMPSASGQPVPAETVSKRSSNEDIRRIAKGYVEKEKLPYQPHDTAIPVREETAKRIADLYDKAVDSPNDPVVKKAYTALANETLKQWKEFEAAGYKAELWTGEGQPYADSAAMMKDVRDNKHIYYFGTEGGFGAGGITPEMRSNPMLAASGVNFEGAKNVPVNDVFRVVHDIVGHGAHGYEFGPKGEFNAYLEHSRMFSDAAKPALAAETLAQNSWVNYGPHLRNANGSLPKKGEAGFIPAAERRFADQKNIVIPDSILKEVDAYAKESKAKFMPADSTPEDFRAGTVKDILNKKNWAVFSAENPHNKEVSAAENAARNAKLEAELNERGLTYEKVKGKYNRDENSFIIHGLDQQAALDLAKKYDQESILTPKGLTYQDGSLEPALGVDTYASDKAPDNFYTTLPDGSHASVQLGDKIHPESIEAQSLKASEAVENAKPKEAGARMMPADLSKSKVKDKDVQFKRKEPLEGAIGGLLEGVHFSSKSLAEIDPQKSFGKGAATSTDMQGEPKVFFYKKGTAYEAPISARSNVYEAKIDGNSIYDYNEDPLNVRSIVNREKRDLALKNAGFRGFYVETPGFDAIAIFDKIGVKESSHENVMSREQLQDAGKLAVSPEEAASRQASEAKSAEESKGAELRLAKAKESVLASKGYELAKARIAKEVGDDYSYEYNDRLDTWADEQAAKKAASKAQFMPASDVVVHPTEGTESGTPAPDDLVTKLPLSGTPIKWEKSSAQFMPSSERSAFPTLDQGILDQIKKDTSTVAAIHIDRMRVGEYKGVDLQGGMFYPTIKDNLEKGVVWAFNSPGVARTVAQRAAANGGYVKLVLMQEGNVIGNKTFGRIWFNELRENIQNKEVSKTAALAALNDARKVVYKTLAEKDAGRSPWVEAHAKKWTSLEEAEQAILSMPQMQRASSYFKKAVRETVSKGSSVAYGALLAQKMTKMGFPDAERLVNNLEEPAFKGVPSGAGVAIIKIDPLAADSKIMTAHEAGVPEHASYGYVLKGKPVAKLEHYQVVDETFPETKGQILTQQHTDFPLEKSAPSSELAKGRIQYGGDLSQAKVSRLSSK